MRNSRSASRQRGRSVRCRATRNAYLSAVTDVHLMCQKQLSLLDSCHNALLSAIVLVLGTVSFTGCCFGLDHGPASSLWLSAILPAATERVDKAPEI